MNITTGELLFLKELLSHELTYGSYGESYGNELQAVYIKINIMLDEMVKAEESK